MATRAAPRRADYGLDAPGLVLAFALIGLILATAGFLFGSLALGGPTAVGPGRAAYWPGASFALSALLMTVSSRFGKLRARDRLLDRLDIHANETVLDVGCGHRLMLLGAAKRVPNGRAVGVDVWSQRDQKDNSAAATLTNAGAEGVRAVVEVRDGDMRALPLPDETVDVVVSSLAIHNVPGPHERERAVREIVRVLRPGGRVGILDIANVGAYARILRESGLTVERNGFAPWIFPPTRELVARKPA